MLASKASVITIAFLLGLLSVLDGVKNTSYLDCD